MRPFPSTSAAVRVSPSRITDGRTAVHHGGAAVATGAPAFGSNPSCDSIRLEDPAAYRSMILHHAWLATSRSVYRMRHDVTDIHTAAAIGRGGNVRAAADVLELGQPLRRLGTA